MTSYWARWRLKSPASRLFTQPFVQGAVNSLHKGPVTRKVFLFNDVIMVSMWWRLDVESYILSVFFSLMVIHPSLFMACKVRCVTNYMLLLLWYMQLGGSPTVYPKKYTHGFCFAVLCCGYTLTDFPISIRLTSLALWQSNDCPSASKATLMNMDKYLMWNLYERLHNHNKAKHNKTVCIFIGIYCILNVI